MLPNFLIVGAPRSGTTHLYKGLRQHPEVFMSDFKEPMFFAYQDDPRPSVISDLGEYENLFREAQTGQVTGEASTLYLYSERAADNIADKIPNAQLIAILRNPVERAFSQYTFQRFLQTEPLETFEAALAAEDGRAETDDIPFHLYTRVGLYSRQIRRYQQRFRPEQLLFLLQDDLDQDPDGVFSQIFQHIGVEASFRPDLRHRTNASGVPQHETLFRTIKSLGRPLKRVLPETLVTRLSGSAHETLLERPMMNPETRSALIERFRDDIEQSSALIGRDLSPWLALPNPSR